MTRARVRPGLRQLRFVAASYLDTSVGKRDQTIGAGLRAVDLVDEELSSHHVDAVSNVCHLREIGADQQDCTPKLAGHLPQAFVYVPFGREVNPCGRLVEYEKARLES